MIDLESAANGAFVVGFGFHEVGQRAKFRALCGDEVALRQDDVVNGRGAELIFLLFGVESLLLQFACFNRGGDLGAVLCERDVGVAYVKKRGVSELLGQAAATAAATSTPNRKNISLALLPFTTSS